MPARRPFVLQRNWFAIHLIRTDRSASRYRSATKPARTRPNQEVLFRVGIFVFRRRWLLLVALRWLLKRIRSQQAAGSIPGRGFSLCRPEALITAMRTRSTTSARGLDCNYRLEHAIGEVAAS